MNRTILLLLSLCSVLSLPRTQLAVLRWQADGLVLTPPATAEPFVPLLHADLDADGTEEYLQLQNQHLRILSGSRLIWQSPPDWEIRQAEITDLDRNRVPEITLLLWRSFAPWPIDAYLPHGGRIAEFHDSENRSCHIILMGKDPDGIRELWAGSALAEPIREIDHADWNKDGFDELLALETSYADREKGTAVSVWIWEGFGFSLLDRMPIAAGRTARLRTSDQQPVLLFDRVGWLIPSREGSP